MKCAFNMKVYMVVIYARKTVKSIIMRLLLDRHVPMPGTSCVGSEESNTVCFGARHLIENGSAAFL
jgi:hypothetical protein